MLKIFNNLQPFFEDNYRQIHVREYASILNITPPTASKLLEEYHAEGLLKKRIDKRHNIYITNRESKLFKNIQQSYWQEKLTPLISYLNTKFLSATII